MNTNPFNNNALIEVMRPDDGVSRTDENESLQYGRIVSVSVSAYHITASSFGELDPSFLKRVRSVLQPGLIVRWEEFAEGGQTFEEDGKTYALIPFWRIISYAEENE